jgi:hypothetical protein
MCISLYSTFSKIKVNKGVFKSYEISVNVKMMKLNMHVSYAVQKLI